MKIFIFIAILIPIYIFLNLNDYKWYRKFNKGHWFKNRYIYHLGRTVIFKWERIKGNNLGGSFYCVESEYYE